MTLYLCLVVNRIPNAAWLCVKRTTNVVAQMIADLWKLQPLECGYFLQHSWFLPSWNSSRTPYCFPLPLLPSLSLCLIDSSFSGFWEGLLFCSSSYCHAFVLAGGSHQEEGVPQGDIVKPWWVEFSCDCPLRFTVHKDHEFSIEILVSFYMWAAHRLKATGIKH